MLYERMLAEHQRLKAEISMMEKHLEMLPEGKLVCARNGKHYKWYCSDGHNQTYIPKKERGFAELLAKKKYLELKLKELQSERRAIESYLQYHLTEPLPSESLLISNTEYRNLLSSSFKPLSKELNEWSNTSYPTNPKYTQQLVHKTTSGKFVRSKSEAIISTLLFSYRVPFRYECELQFGEILVYPDFTIRHPKTGKTYYWEHFGRMDDPVYSKTVPIKLQTYISHGIIPTIQLITTYETAENPLSSENVERIIKEYFL